MKYFMRVIFGLAVGLLLLGFSTVRTEAKDSEGNIVVVVDAGHGGTDPGKIAVTGAYESAINLQIATALRDELKKYDGVKVYITRSQDEWLTNTGRSMVAAALNADFLISCHNNSADSADTHGALVIRTINPIYAEKTNDMATLILAELTALGFSDAGIISRADDKHPSEDYYTLIGEGVRAGVPSIIIEHCFLSNREDAMMVSNEDGSVNNENCKRLGVADATAVAKYFHLSLRTRVADSTSVLTLPKGYSVKVTAPAEITEAVSWYSLDASIATVAEDGTATMQNAGTTNIVYKTSDGNTGYLTVTVEQTAPTALVGCINPTFYDDESNIFANIDLYSAFGFEIFSDGTSYKVSPALAGNVDFTKIGIQDIPITYDGLTGYIRVCHNTAEYVPVVTEAPSEVETLPPTTEATEAESETESVVESETGNGVQVSFWIDLSPISIVIYVVVLLGLIAIGLLIARFERNRRNNRGRRHY